MKENYNFKHWSEIDRISQDQAYFESDNKKLFACIVSPHSGNEYKWMLRVANVKGFDKWSFAEVEKYFDSENELIDYLSSIDVNERLISNDERDFYESNEGAEWTVCHCNQIVSGKPHYRDNEDENDYIICPICGEKVYVAE